MTETKFKVFIKGPPFYDMTRRTFLEAGYGVVTTLSEADGVVWTGGEDIWPGLYNEKPLPGTYFTTRDKGDLAVVEAAVKKNLYLIGICRGAQLLNVVPNGGSLWQDVDNHGSCLHKTFDCVTGTWKLTNSVHHQSLRLTEDAELLAWAQESTKKVAEKIKWFRPPPKPDGSVLEKDKDVEAAWYPKTKSFLFQGHPEFGHPPTTKYFFELMDRYVLRKSA